MERRGYMAALLRPALADGAVRVIEARTPGDCLRALRDHTAATVLLDVDELSFGTADLVLRLQEAGPDARAIVLYAAADPHIQQAVREAGAAHVMHKPIGGAALLALVQS